MGKRELIRSYRDLDVYKLAMEGAIRTWDSPERTQRGVDLNAVGLLINFNVSALRRGIKRIVHDYKETSAPSAPLL